MYRLLYQRAVHLPTPTCRMLHRTVCINTITTLSRQPTQSSPTTHLTSLNTITSRHVYRPTRSFSSITIPPIADSISEGTVATINKAVGDSVEKDEVVMVLETDKVSVDVRSEISGTIESIDAKEGDTVKVGDSVMSVKEGAAGGSSTNDKKSASAEPKSDTEKSNNKSSKKDKSDKSDKHDSKQQQQSSKSNSSQQQQQQSTQQSSDSHGRTPMIKFTHGRGNTDNKQSSQPQQQSSKQQSSQSQQPQKSSSDSSNIVATFNAVLYADPQFTSDNDRAYEAYMSLPQKYKRKPYDAAAQAFIELGGADDYQPKQKGRK